MWVFRVANWIKMIHWWVRIWEPLQSWWLIFLMSSPKLTILANKHPEWRDARSVWRSHSHCSLGGCCVFVGQSCGLKQFCVLKCLTASSGIEESQSVVFAISYDASTPTWPTSSYQPKHQSDNPIPENLKVSISEVNASWLQYALPWRDL